MNKTGNTFYFIPHTHWEGAVFKTREEYLEMGLPNILRALKLLKDYPNYRFVLDQTCYVKPFLERYPEEETAFRQFVAEGRLALVGGTDVMLDVNMPGGESFVRQVLYGKSYFRNTLGVDVTIGWQLDTFGHHAQMPQLLNLAGFKSFWFFRGVSDWNVPSEFFWEGLDGSRIPAFWLPYGYANTYASPKSLPEFTDFFKKQYNELNRFTMGYDRVGLAGADVSEPEEYVPPLVEQFNKQSDIPFSIQIATPKDYEAAVEKRSIKRPIIKGELNPIFQGIYSSRIELKQRTRELETLLTLAEKLTVLNRWLGHPVDEDVLWRAWESMLFNQTHDMMSGVMTDHVYEDSIRDYNFSKRIASEEVQTKFQSLIADIDSRGEGIPLVVFNSLGWSRTDVAYANVGFTENNVVDLQLVNCEGQTIPIQIMEAERYSNGGLLRARIAFIARDIPALGYSVYHLLALKSTVTPPETATSQGKSILENEYYRLELDPATGAITDLYDKVEKWHVLDNAGNIIAMEEDHGDFWELYRSLDGGSRIAMKDRHEPPQKGKAIFSTDQSGTPGTVKQGPVLSEFTVSHPFGKKGQFTTTVLIYAGLRRIDIRTKILNNDQFVRYRVLFPTSIQQGQNIHEIPFGAIQRPDGIEFPAQNWIDYSDGQKGIALLNRGLPGNNVANGTMMLSLMRSTCIVAYGFGGGYEPGMTSDSGFELGKELTFDYSLVPHSGNWQQSAIYREGMEYNHPLITRTASSHQGVLPQEWGFLKISHPDIVVSTLKISSSQIPSEGKDAVLRVYEAAGLPADHVEIRFSVPVIFAEEVNLMEDPGIKLDVTKDTLQLNFRPFEIKTIKLNI